MKRYSKMLSLALLAAAAVLFPIAAGARISAEPQQQGAGAQEQEPEYSVEEYEAYENATKEPDPSKRAGMLMAFIDKYPKSKLMTYIEAAYQTLMYECSQAKKYDVLEPVAEEWLKLHPNDLQTTAYIAEAAQANGNHSRCVECAEKIYAEKPSGDLAYKISQIYKQLGKEDKYLEWTEKLFAYPQFEAEYGLRSLFMQKYADEKNFPKAAEYAQLTLKSVELSNKPEAEVNPVRRVCYYLMGLNAYDAGRFPEAIKFFQQAVRAEKFSEGYYYMGMCEWKQDRIEEAMVCFARAELHGGTVADQAKEHLEELYKALHNNTTIGIDKVYKRAKEQSEGAAQ